MVHPEGAAARQHIEMLAGVIMRSVPRNTWTLAEGSFVRSRRPAAHPWFREIRDDAVDAAIRGVKCQPLTSAGAGLRPLQGGS
jgi:hypothetical protein